MLPDDVPIISCTSKRCFAVGKSLIGDFKIESALHRQVQMVKKCNIRGKPLEMLNRLRSLITLLSKIISKPEGSVEREIGSTVSWWN